MSAEPHRSAAEHHANDAHGDVRVVDLDIPSDIQQIESVVERVQRECAAMHFGARQLMLNLPVALTEALSNAILRGNGEDASKLVHVTARVDATHLVVDVRDEGEGFDLDGCTIDPTTPANVDREDGRGLFLMRKLMDRVERFADAGGNTVRLTLRRQ